MKLFNKTFHKEADHPFESRNYQQLMLYLTQEIKDKLKEIMPRMPTRTKRGAFNFLGSIWKAISGNLDEEDGQKYEQIIDKLRSQQRKQTEISNKHMSLTLTAINNFNQSISQLQRNQKILETRLLQVEGIARTTQDETARLEDMLRADQVYSQIISMLLIIKEILQELETAITFARINTMHLSILTPSELLQELLKFKRIKPSLPYELTPETVSIYEQIINVKAYQLNTKITFILEIPLVESSTYKLYHLYSLPIEKQYPLFQSITPTSKYLILNEQSYAFLQSPCKEIQKTKFLCHEETTSNTKSAKSCEIQLLQFHSNITTCEQHLYKLHQEKIQKIENNQWIFISPQKLVIKYRCNSNEITTQVQGTYLLHIPNTCEVTINQRKLKPQHSNRISTQVVPIPNYQPQFEKKQEDKALDSHPINLEPVHLDNMQQIQDQLARLKETASDDDITIHKNISVWTVLLYIIISCIILSIIIKYVLVKRKIRFLRRTENPAPYGGLILENQTSL